MSDGRFEPVRVLFILLFVLLFVGRFAFSVRAVFEVCELGGGGDGFAERLSDGRFELLRLLFVCLLFVCLLFVCLLFVGLLFVRLLFRERFVPEGRSDVLLRLGEFDAR